MPFRDVKRECPYCGAIVVLDDCAIVSTSATAKESRFDDEEDDEQASSIDAVALGRRPVLQSAKVAGNGGLGRRVTRLRSPSEIMDPSTLPRRACTNCGAAFPEEMDEFDALVLAVVGLNRAGKSYLIGSTLNAATRGDGLAEFGVVCFTPLDDTPSRLHNDYYRQLFSGEHSLLATAVTEHLEKAPLSFLVEMTDAEPFVLITHDVSGEALMDRSSRAATAGFVSRADAIIFVADPLDMRHLAGRLPRADCEQAGLRNLDQSALLEAVLRETVSRRKGRGTPLALTISKSDLVSRAMQKNYGFSVPRAGSEWRGEISATSKEVRDLLLSLGERKIVNLVDRHDPHSFHAVSVLGSASEGSRPEPIRVLDPLGTVLEQVRRLRNRGH